MSSKEESENIILNTKKLKDTAPQEEKIYLNLYYFKLSYGILYTYLFIAASMIINIVNRVIFLQYKFKFNLLLILLHQIFCIIFFKILSKMNKSFIQMAGEISIKDFLKLKYQYSSKYTYVYKPKKIFDNNDIYISIFF